MAISYGSFDSRARGRAATGGSVRAWLTAAWLASSLGCGDGADISVADAQQGQADAGGGAGRDAAFDVDTGAEDAAVAKPDSGTTLLGNDPGRPKVQYGPKGEAFLKLDGQKAGYIFFTALAPVAADRSHLFLQPESRANENVSDYYLSLVFEQAQWRTGSYSSALAGQAYITLSSGKRYGGTADVLELSCDIADVVDLQGAELYLKGACTMTLPAPQAGDPPLTVEMKINSL